MYSSSSKRFWRKPLVIRAEKPFPLCFTFSDFAFRIFSRTYSTVLVPTQHRYLKNWSFKNNSRKCRKCPECLVQKKSWCVSKSFLKTQFREPKVSFQWVILWWNPYFRRILGNPILAYFQSLIRALFHRMGCYQAPDT